MSRIIDKFHRLEKVGKGIYLVRSRSNGKQDQGEEVNNKERVARVLADAGRDMTNAEIQAALPDMSKAAVNITLYSAVTDEKNYGIYKVGKGVYRFMSDEDAEKKNEEPVVKLDESISSKIRTYLQDSSPRSVTLNQVAGATGIEQEKAAKAISAIIKSDPEHYYRVGVAQYVYTAELPLADRPQKTEEQIIPAKEEAPTPPQETEQQIETAKVEVTVPQPQEARILKYPKPEDFKKILHFEELDVLENEVLIIRDENGRIYRAIPEEIQQEVRHFIEINGVKIYTD